MGNYWLGKNALVTGGSGFIGSHIVRMLVKMGSQVTATTSLAPNPSSLVNLSGVRSEVSVIAVDLTKLEDCRKVCRDQNVIFNLAHVDGSAAFKGGRPAFIFRQNMLITLNMLEAAFESKVERSLLTSSADVYSYDAPAPTFDPEGRIEVTDQSPNGYAWSKRMSEYAARLFAQEHGLKVAIARPNNVYGPGDFFDAQRGRVIPMFIEKVLRGDGPIMIWGTGEQVRSFLYVEDLARGMLDLIEKYPECDPINFSGEEEITVRELAELIIRLSGKEVKIICDLTKPSGPLRRVLDTTKAKRILGFTPATPLTAGLRRTISIYRERLSPRKSVQSRATTEAGG